MTSPKRHFLKNFPTEFDKIFRQGVKLMSNKVLRVSWRYRMYLSSYSEYSRGGRICPPAGRGLTHALMGLWIFHHLFFFFLVRRCAARRSSGLLRAQEASPAQEPDHGIWLVLQHRQRRRVTEVPRSRSLVAWAVAYDVLCVLLHSALRAQAVRARPLPSV